MAPEQGCMFCSIVAGEVPADVVHSGERVIAFRDINPQAPLHVLVVPRDHHRDVPALATTDPQALAELVEVGAGLAAGGRLLEVFSVVPLVRGHGLSIGLTSYDGQVFAALNADRDAVGDVDVLADLIEQEIEEMAAATG